MNCMDMWGGWGVEEDGACRGELGLLLCVCVR